MPGTAVRRPVGMEPGLGGSPEDVSRVSGTGQQQLSCVSAGRGAAHRVGRAGAVTQAAAGGTGPLPGEFEAFTGEEMKEARAFLKR
jgi:hypothetical protein